MFNRPSSIFNISKLVHVAMGFQLPVQGSWTLNNNLATVLWTYNGFKSLFPTMLIFESPGFCHYDKYFTIPPRHCGLKKCLLKKSLIVNTTKSRLIM